RLRAGQPGSGAHDPASLPELPAGRCPRYGQPEPVSVPRCLRYEAAGHCHLQRDRAANRRSTTDLTCHRPIRCRPSSNLVSLAGAVLDRDSGCAHCTVHTRGTVASLAATTPGEAGSPRNVAEATGDSACPISRSRRNGAGYGTPTSSASRGRYKIASPDRSCPATTLATARRLSAR